MESPPVVPSVEFERRRLAPEAAVKGLEVAVQGPAGQRFVQRIHGVRAAVVLLGALGVAFLTQRLGFGLPGALCVFLGLLPVLWAAGWLGGLLFSTRRLATDVSQHLERAGGPQALARRWHLERVRLEVRDDGLWLDRRGELGDAQQTWAWRDVRFNRPGPVAALLGLGPGEVLEVPASAFASEADFDAFCLALQAKLWRAERA